MTLVLRNGLFFVVSAIALACGDGAVAAQADDAAVPAPADDAGGPPADASGAEAAPADASPPAAENTDALCSNGIDDDHNGYTDCNDYGCSKNPSVTVCNPEFYKPLPAPVTNDAPIASKYLVGALAIGWSAKNRLFVGAGVAGSLGGSLLITDGHLVELDPKTAKALSEIASASTSYVGLAVSPDERFVVGGTRAGGVIDLVDISGSAPVVTTESHAVSNEALAFSGDSRFVYAGGTETYFDPPTVERYDLTMGSLALRSQQVGKATEIFGLQVSGAALDTFTSEGLATLDPSTLAISKTGASPPPAGAIGVAMMGAKHIYYTASSCGPIAIPGAPIARVDIHPDYRTAAVLQTDGTLRLVDTVSNKLGAPVQAHAKLGSAVAFSADGTYLVSTGISPAVAIFRLK